MLVFQELDHLGQRRFDEFEPRVISQSGEDLRFSASLASQVDRRVLLAPQRQVGPDLRFGIHDRRFIREWDQSLFRAQQSPGKVPVPHVTQRPQRVPVAAEAGRPEGGWGRGAVRLQFEHLGRDHIFGLLVAALVHQGIEPIHQLLDFLPIAGRFLNQLLPLVGCRAVLFALGDAGRHFDRQASRFADRAFDLVLQLSPQIRAQIRRTLDGLEPDLQLALGRLRLLVHLLASLADRLFDFRLQLLLLHLLEILNLVQEQSLTLHFGQQPSARGGRGPGCAGILQVDQTQVRIVGASAFGGIADQLSLRIVRIALQHGLRHLQRPIRISRPQRITSQLGQ